MLSRRAILLLLAIALSTTPSIAYAGDYIVYLHGRATRGWPSGALLGVPLGWSHLPLSYDGSAGLTNSAVREVITNAIATHCSGGNHCVVVCHSAGCARMLDAYRVLRDQGRYPSNILWSEAAASAAGGTEIANIVTRWHVKLIAKLFNVDAAIDDDLRTNVLRFGAHAAIQDQATSPVYHLAGSRGFCITLRIAFFIKLKLCSNAFFPGGHGDGLVPVHSAAGYADADAHASMQDGSAKYLFRAYEQIPLYPVDHIGILAPLVTAGSLRLAVGKSANCPSAAAIDTALPNASIIFDDGDGAFSEESSPLSLLALCGNNLWDGSPPLYATCLGTARCCTDFSAGSAGGCSCGETLCRQAQVGTRSYYTGENCSGIEYSESFGSYDGLGMVGESTTTVSAKSARTGSDGRCQVLLHRVTWGGDCPETRPTSTRLAVARRVYRPAGAPVPPSGNGPGLIVSSTNNTGMCP